MKNKILFGWLIILMGCTSANERSSTSALRPIDLTDAGSVSVGFQVDYSDYILHDSPIVYIPTFNVDFNQTIDSYVDVNSSGLDSLDDFTVEFWFNPTVTGTFESDSSCVVDTHEVSQKEGFAFYWQEAASTFYLLSSNGSTATSISVFDETDLLPNSNHVVIVTTSSGFDVYLNGVRVKQVSYGSYNASENSPVRIAACINDSTGVPYSHYVGQLDNFAMYDYELSSDEILQHYAVGADLLSR